MTTMSAACHKGRMMEASGAGWRAPMAIIGIIVAALAAVGIWYWRIKMIREVTDDVTDVIGRARGAYRMNKFRKQAEASPLTSVTNPAMAAAIFLYALADEQPERLHLAEEEIQRQIGKIVGAADLDEILSYSRWAANDVADPRDLVRRFKPLWREKLTRDERSDLIAMAQAIMSVSDADPAHNQKLSFATLRTALAPEPK